MAKKKIQKKQKKQKQKQKQKQTQNVKQSVVIKISGDKLGQKEQKEQTPLIETWRVYDAGRPYIDEGRFLMPLKELKTSLTEIINLGKQQLNIPPIEAQLADNMSQNDSFNYQDLTNFNDEIETFNRLNKKTELFISNNNTQNNYEDLLDFSKQLETYNRLNKENELLIDFNKKKVKIENDILENYRKSSDVFDEEIFEKGASAEGIIDLTNEELEEKTKQRFRRNNNIECDICKGSYDPNNAYSSQKHFSTKKHQQALNKLENVKKN